MYGAGVLLLRELTVRVDGGWPTLALLGVVYQLAEDGLGLQALTSPRMYGAADWGVRALGINWSYWESQIGVHVVLSVLIPVAITDTLFPGQKGRPYLRNRGLIGVAALATLGVLGLRVLISGTQHPGYQTPVSYMMMVLVLMSVLAVTALAVLPRVPARRVKASTSAPHPVVVGFVSMYLTMAFLTTLLPLGLSGSTLLLGDLMSPGQRLVIAMMTAIPFALVVLRWLAAPTWSDRHMIWLFGGILASHTAFMMVGSWTAAIIGALTIAGEVFALTRLAKGVQRREIVGIQA
jgi:hypothetical protein